MSIKFTSDPDLDRGDSLVLLSPCDAIGQVRTIVCGDSHARAVSQALLRWQQVPHVAAKAREAGVAALRGHLVDGYWDTLVSLAPQRNVAIVWQGNQFNRNFMFATRDAFDFIPASRQNDPLIEGAMLIPEARVREYSRLGFDMLEGLLKRLSELSGTRVFVVGTPAARCEPDEVRRRFDWEPGFAAVAGSLGVELASVPITPLTVRIKLWSVLQDVVAETAAANGATFLAIPPGTLADDGSLRREYWADDITHANVRFGALVVEHLLSHLDS